MAHLVEGHVLAKRYLCFKDPEYYSKLSPASKTTLEFQGGFMAAEEAKMFERGNSLNHALCQSDLSHRGAVPCV